MPEFRIDDLNSEQLRAATAGEGPVLTIAGAGTGKTKTLAARVAWLVSLGVAGMVATGLWCESVLGMEVTRHPGFA
jgi:ATP-dependent exoDNAse (exonuclease V) beta subunit